MNQDVRSHQFKEAFLAAFPYAIPVMTSFIILGIAYGVLMQTKGYGTLWSVLMSAIAFCGSMQFFAITLLTVPFNPIQAFLLSLMVNARHLFYGISMLEKYNNLGKIRFFLIYTLCDETFSIASSAPLPLQINRRYFYFSLSTLHYSAWVFGTLCGGLAGQYITFDTTGLDFSLTALFVVLFMEQLRTPGGIISGSIGVGCTLAGLLLFRANLVIPSMLFILIVLLGGRKKLCT